MGKEPTSVRTAKNGSAPPTRTRRTADSLHILAVASHEIRAQVNTVIGFGELLRETELDLEQKEYVERLSAAARRLIRFTTDIVDLADPKTQALEFRETTVDLQGIVEDVCASVLPNAREKGLGLRCEVADDVPPRVLADPQRLQQVLTNLIRNAVKFTEKGEVIVRAKATAWTKRFSTVLFSVSDTGIGISPERREAIFEPFEQEDLKTRVRFGGSGLGLAIARELVQRMNGSLWVESKPGVGSTFAFMVRLQRR